MNCQRNFIAFIVCFGLVGSDENHSTNHLLIRYQTCIKSIYFLIDFSDCFYNSQYFKNKTHDVAVRFYVKTHDGVTHRTTKRTKVSS